MHESFYLSTYMKDLLFEGVEINSTYGMVSVCIGFACLSFLTEGLKAIHLHIISTYEQPENPTGTVLFRLKFSNVGVQTFIHTLRLGIGYIIMLTVMTFNAYFLIAALVGTGLGFLCFGYINFIIQYTKLSPFTQRDRCCLSKDEEDNPANASSSTVATLEEPETEELIVQH